MRNAYKILVTELVGKSPLGRYRRRWEDNMRLDLSEMMFEVVDCIFLAQDRDHLWALVNVVMNLRVP
jgi:hypothetical protein